MLFRTTFFALVGLSLTMFQITPVIAAECADEVKKTLENSTWKLTTEFTNSDGTQTYTVSTEVTADGQISVSRRRSTYAVRCNGKDIVFDWRNDSDRRYTLTFEKDGLFKGYRTGSRDDYHATLTKTSNRSSKRARRVRSRRDRGNNSIPTVRPISGSYEVAPGGKVVVYSIAGAECDAKPPSFDQALRINERRGGTNTVAEGGKLYDAGIARYRSRKCGGWVMSRAIGFVADREFTGTVDLKFGRRSVDVTGK